MKINSSFFSYSLILILWEISLTKEVIYSVTSHLDQVIATIILSVIVMFWFTTISYNLWTHSDEEGYAFEDKMECGSLFNCLRVHFDYGYIFPPVWRQVPIPTATGTIWNYTFNLFCNIILTAIISGIIIDTFGERREKREFIKNDTLNKCFICNIDREVKIIFLNLSNLYFYLIFIL